MSGVTCNQQCSCASSPSCSCSCSAGTKTKTGDSAGHAVTTDRLVHWSAGREAWTDVLDKPPSQPKFRLCRIPIGDGPMKEVVVSERSIATQVGLLCRGDVYCVLVTKVDE